MKKNEKKKERKKRLFGQGNYGDTREGKREKEWRVWAGAILDYRFVNSIIG